jgi:predicted PurR-regulated permease PerM
LTDDAPTPPAPVRNLVLPTGGPLAALAALVLTLIAILALKEVAEIVVPVIFGLFLALIAAPMIGWFERKGLRRPLALSAAILVVLAVVVLTAGMIALSVGELVVQVPRYQDRLAEQIATIRDLLAQAGVNTETDAITSIISPSMIATFVKPVASAVTGAGAAIFILAFTLIYALAGAGSMRARAEASFGADHRLILGVERFGADLRRYLLVRAELGLFAAVLVFVMLFILGVPLPALWAFLVFAASFIPNIGFILALIPPTILAFLDGGLVPALIVVAGFTVINFLQDHLLQPIVMGSELNLSPLVVMISVIAWAWILGASGALLAVPLTVGLVAIMEAFPGSREIAALLRNRLDEPVTLAPPPDPEPPAAAGGA